MSLPISSLPAVDQAALPADIRKASKTDQQTYAAALSFEKTMLNELMKSAPSLTGTGGDDDSAGGDSAPAAYKDMLPGALADSLTAQGGTGIAREIYASLKAEKKS